MPPVAWPPVAYEELFWRPALDAATGLVARRALDDQTGPYLAAITPPIASVTPTLTNPVLLELESAGDAIARLDADGCARLAPFAGVLLRAESASSSQIEHLTASARAIAEAEIGASRSGNGPMIAANAAAMRVAIAAPELGLAQILEMHQVLLGGYDPAIAGHWRTEQVWIGGSDFGPRRAQFVPPAAHRVPTAMADLVDFMARSDLPVLAQAAIAHAQFETIHPFADGNGRTGRALLHAMLRVRGLASTVIVPVSAGLLTHVDAYFAALTAYRAGELTPIITSMAHAAVRACTNARQLLADLTGIRDEWGTLVQARRDSATWQVLDLMLSQPVVDSRVLAAELGQPIANNASRYLRPLIEAGIVVETAGRNRMRLWRAPVVLGALDDFARRAGRRDRPGETTRT
ncbi:MAG: Fic family protein [Candidatus Nanopelagicales bacterium]